MDVEVLKRASEARGVHFMGTWEACPILMGFYAKVPTVYFHEDDSPENDSGKNQNW
ncbi:hypothetical protein [Thermococcus sp.]